MPAGLVGDIHAGESIEVSAVRELEEETGWTADHAEVLLIGPTSSGASSEKIAFVRATGLRRIGEGVATTARTSSSTRFRAVRQRPGWCRRWAKATSWTPSSGPGCG